MMAMPMQKQAVAEILKWAARQGRNGDSVLAHITKKEQAVLKKRGGAGTINPKTGLLEFFGDGDNGQEGNEGNQGDPGKAGEGSVGPDTSNPTGDPVGDSGKRGESLADPDTISHNVVDNLGNPVATFDVTNMTPDMISKLDQAGRAGVFGGVGSANPTDAIGAQVAMAEAGLGGFGIGSGAPPSVAGSMFADIVGDVITGMSPIAALEGKPQSIAGVIGSMLSPTPDVVGIAASLGKSIATGSLGKSIAGIATDPLGTAVDAGRNMASNVSIAGISLNDLGNLGNIATDRGHSNTSPSAPSDSGQSGGGNADRRETSSQIPDKPLDYTEFNLNDNIFSDFAKRFARLHTIQKQIADFDAVMGPRLRNLDEMRSEIGRSLA